MNTFKSLLACCGLVLSINAQASPLKTGNDLLSQLEGSKGEVQQVFAVGYSAGVLLSSPVVCIGPTVTYNQLKDVLIKELKDTPEIRHYHPVPLIEVIGMVHFPCPQEKKTKI